MTVPEAIDILIVKHNEALICLSEQINNAALYITYANEFLQEKGLLIEYTNYLNNKLKKETLH